MIRSAFAIAVFMAALEKKGCFWQLRVQVLECWVFLWCLSACTSR